MTDSFHSRLWQATERIGGQAELARRLETRPSTISSWFGPRGSWPTGPMMILLPEALALNDRPLNGHWLLTGQGHPYMPPAGGRYMDGVRDERERLKRLLDAP